MKRALIILFVLLAVAAGAIGLTLGRPFQGFQTESFIEFPKGTGTMEMARRLAEAGVIPTRWHLLAARALRPSQRWQAGEYRFQKAATVWEVADRLRRGDVYLVELRIPEGYNLYDVAAAIEQAGLVKAQAFLAEARHPSPIRDLAPQAPSLEGFLFPSTYHVPRKITAEALCRLFTEQFRKEWKAAGGNGNVDGIRTTTTLRRNQGRANAPDDSAA